jgi:thiamine-monophosphate kinase
MALNEFGLIQRYFKGLTPATPDVVLGIGDDAALLTVPDGHELVWSIDTLVEGVHFAHGADPVALGHKALAVNLSDLAAMGADPHGVVLALTLPQADEAWCEGFAKGFGALAVASGIPLVGGDMTRGPLAISVSVLGRVPRGRALRREGAKIGDDIAVTGPLGDAALALQLGDSAPEMLRRRLEMPVPHLAAGSLLRDWASAAIDVSDGLMADLQHLCTASGVGAVIRADHLPRSPAFAALEVPDALALQAGGGDDYVLCLALPPEAVERAQAALQAAGLGSLHVIGQVVEGDTARLVNAAGAPVLLASAGYRHY